MYMEGRRRCCQIDVAGILARKAVGLPEYKFEHDIYYQLWPNK